MEGFWVIQVPTWEPLEFVTEPLAALEAAEAWDDFVGERTEIIMGDENTFGNVLTPYERAVVNDAHERFRLHDLQFAVPEAKCSHGVPWSEHREPDMYNPNLIQCLASRSYDLMSRGIDFPEATRFCQRRVTA